jgi:hypothetical protein
MEISEHDLLVQLQARILAQEMFMRAVLTAAFMNTSNPLAALEEIRFEQSRAAQGAVRPRGVYEDKVWETAMKAFHNELNQVATRLETHGPGLSSRKPAAESRNRPGETAKEVRQSALHDS